MNGKRSRGVETVGAAAAGKVTLEGAGQGSPQEVRVGTGPGGCVELEERPAD